MGARVMTAALGVSALLVMGASVSSQSPGAVGPDDARLGALRDLDGHFPFAPSASKAEWEARAVALRRQVRVALGLWPWPTRTPLNAVVHGAVAREGYTVERAFFESVPGHFVTGSLYRPTGRTGRLPAVLSPHGHWPGGFSPPCACPSAALGAQAARGRSRIGRWAGLGPAGAPAGQKAPAPWHRSHRSWQASRWPWQSRAPGAGLPPPPAARRSQDGWPRSSRTRWWPP